MRKRSEPVGKSSHELSTTDVTFSSRFGVQNVDTLKPHPSNARRHSQRQVKAIAKSIAAFGFNAPILANDENIVIAGHGRLEAARSLGIGQVPVIRLSHLSDAQTKAYLLADNKLGELSSWDDHKLALGLKELSDLSLDFEIEATGFELPEIDLSIQSLDEVGGVDADIFELSSGPAVSKLGDLWTLGTHRIFCGNALEEASYVSLGDEEASAVFTDPPYNVRIDGHAGGSGALKHREFAMASGEMNNEEFTRFLGSLLKHAAAHVRAGSIMFACMDWRHMQEMLTATVGETLELVNLCVWVKSNGGMGSFYRSRHELVFVLRKGSESHTNNVQLGRFGRNRSNVWHYAGATGLAGKSGKRLLDLHPTVKPIGLVEDALIDSTNRHDLILDPCLGSGTTLLAAERKERRCYGIELDPLYVDTAILRFERLTGQKARLPDGTLFEAAKAARRS